MGQMGWLLSFFTSFVVYFCICKVWPTRNQRRIKELGLKWEQMGFDDEIVAVDGVVLEDKEGAFIPVMEVVGEEAKN